MTDIKVSESKLVKRSNDDPDGYWPWEGRKVKMPDYRSTDTVKDTELISTFIERSKFTDVIWIKHPDNNWINDVKVLPYWCEEDVTPGRNYQCVPPHIYGQRYIWTAPQQHGISM